MTGLQVEEGVFSRSLLCVICDPDGIRLRRFTGQEISERVIGVGRVQLECREHNVREGDVVHVCFSV